MVPEEKQPLDGEHTQPVKSYPQAAEQNTLCDTTNLRARLDAGQKRNIHDS